MYNSYDHHLENRIAALEEHIKQLHNKHSETHSVGEIKMPGNGNGNAQSHQVQVNSLQTLDNLVHAETFGLTSMPPVGSMASIVHPGGQVGAASYINATEHTSRPRTLTPGDNIVYDAFDNSMALNSGGITIATGTGEQNITVHANNDLIEFAQNLISIATSILTIASTGSFTLNPPASGIIVNGDIHVAAGFNIYVNGVRVVVP